MKIPDRNAAIGEISERHQSFCDWFQASQKFVQIARAEKFASFTHLNQIPALETRWKEIIRKDSFTIPPAARDDKLAFCFAVLKIYIRSVEDQYDGEYLLGRSRNTPSPNLFIMRRLACDHLAMVFLHLSLEGNQVNVQISYSAYNSRISSNGTFCNGYGFSDTGRQSNFGHLTIDFFNSLASLPKDNQRPKAESLLDGAFGANKYWKNFSNPFLLPWIVVTIFAYGVLLPLANAPISAKDKATIDDSLFTLPLYTFMFYGVIYLVANSMSSKGRLEARRKESLDSFEKCKQLDITPFMFAFGNFQALAKIDEHRIFFEKMLQSLDITIKGIEHFSRLET